MGFQAIRLRFELALAAEPEKIADLIRLTERYCVVLQTLRVPPAVTVSVAP